MYFWPGSNLKITNPVLQFMLFTKIILKSLQDYFSPYDHFIKKSVKQHLELQKT